MGDLDFIFNKYELFVVFCGYFVIGFEFGDVFGGSVKWCYFGQNWEKKIVFVWLFYGYCLFGDVFEFL